MKASGRAWAVVERLIADKRLAESQRKWAEHYYDRDPRALLAYARPK